VFSGLQIYAGQLVWPYGKPFPDIDTAYVYVAGKAGGTALLQLVNFTLLVAGVGSGLGAQLAASRLLYGMGRDDAIPKKFFGVLDERTRTPRNNVLFTGVLALVGSYLLSYQLGAEMMNFGAFIAFIGVNLAALVHYSVRGRDYRLVSWLPPVAGSMICFYIWLHLRWPAMVLGTVWLAAGVLYGARKKTEFRTDYDDPVQLS
jgi:amino acid transporter